MVDAGVKEASEGNATSQNTLHKHPKLLNANGNLSTSDQHNATKSPQALSESREAVNMFPYFSGWNTNDIEECCLLSRIRKFQPEETVFGDGFEELNYVYFVMEGTCQVVQSITMSARRNKHVPLQPHHPQKKLQPRENVDVFFAEVCLLHRKSVFGLGENMKDRRIIAISSVKCLLVPNNWIVQHSTNDIWVRIRQFLKRTVPSHEKVIKAFLQQRNWTTFRQNLVQTLQQKRCMLNETTVHDIPYSIRIKSEAATL